MTSTPGAARRVRETQRDAPRSHEPLPTRVDGLPELPASYRAVLAHGLRVLGLDDLSAEQRVAIDDHVRLLLSWTEAINLTAIRAPDDVAREHVLDSLAAVALLRGGDVRRVIDLGSGGGFPGIPLGVVLDVDRTLLVESVGKKARFLATAVGAIGRSRTMSVAATRAETLAGDPHHRERWDAVVVRAVASLPELAELALPLLRERGRLIAWKREPLEAEIESGRRALRTLGGFLAAVHAVPVDGLGDHRLVVVEKVAQTPAQFPRDPALRKRQAW